MWNYSFEFSDTDFDSVDSTLYDKIRLSGATIRFFFYDSEMVFVK